MTTREKILLEVYKDMRLNGFQGVRPDKVIKKLGLSKGALYHYFDSKKEIGYSIVEEIIQPEYLQAFIPLLSHEGDPVEYILHEILMPLKNNMTRDSIRLGSPVGSLVQEMAPLDEGFRTRLEIILATARDILADALKRGQAKGFVSPQTDSGKVASFIQTGIEGTYTIAKASNNEEQFSRNIEMLGEVLHGIRA